MKNKKSTIALWLIFIIGLSLLLYPSVSDYWNSFRQTKAIAGYVEKVATMDAEEYARVLKSAEEYNEMFLGRKNLWVLNEEQTALYENQLNINGDGIMGYIEIPKINCSLSIYHGTSDKVLQVAVGHLEGSSLPVGGKGTHCVLSRHRGLPSAQLFTNLDQLAEGDVFMLYVLGETYTYEVDQIRIVDPDDLSELAVEEDKDLCTLVTCTPYGVNSHRLLVRGHRADNEVVSNIVVTADAVLTDETVVSVVIATPVLLGLLVFVLLRSRKRK